jgi:hypothetical protein
MCFCTFFKISKEEKDQKSSNLSDADFRMNESTVEMTDYYKVHFSEP